MIQHQSSAPGSTLTPPLHAHRDRHFLRLVCAKFSHLFTMARPLVSRGVVEGIDVYLMEVFGPLYDEVNRSMEEILEDLEGVPDPDVWRYIYENDIRYQAPVSLMLAQLMPFRDFDRSMQRIIAAVNVEVRGDAAFTLTEDRFHVLFAIWFGDFFAFAAQDRFRFELLYGADRWQPVQDILREFRRRAPEDVAQMAGTFAG